MKKIFKGALLLILIAMVVAVLYVVITFPPVMAGMAAKTICSCVYVSGRTLTSVMKKELQVFPGLAKATIEFDDTDSTVTAKILWPRVSRYTGRDWVVPCWRHEQKMNSEDSRLYFPPPRHTHRTRYLGLSGIRPMASFIRT